MNASENKALYALSRLFTDNNHKRFGSSLNEPAEIYYCKYISRLKMQWITFAVALVVAIATLLVHHLWGDISPGPTITVGIFAGIVTFIVSRQIPEFPGENVITLARAWAPNRRKALWSGLVQLISSSIERQPKLKIYIGSGMPYSFKKSEVGTPCGDGWRIIESSFVGIAENIAQNHHQAKQLGLPRQVKALAIEYGTLSLFAREIGMEIPDLDTLSK